MERGVILQKTVKTAIHCRGIGVHSGSRVALTLHPAPADSGIVFRRSDRGGVDIAADWRNVKESALCTTLVGPDGISVGTVEHLMAAFAGAEIDNCLVELDGPEVPIMDGSAAPFLFLIECAGIVEQAAPRRAIRVLKQVQIGDGERLASLTPADDFAVNFEIDFPNSLVRRQEISLTLDPVSFKTDVARARTFGFVEDIASLRAAGLARGGSLDNAVVVSGGAVLNTEGLRYANEFVRHKALDAVGDLYLAGAPILGHFHGVRSGHAYNHRLLAALFSDPNAWCLSPLEAGFMADAAD